nr:MAG TPA: hypothetical protein [Caudoviricetes sp.]
MNVVCHSSVLLKLGIIFRSLPTADKVKQKTVRDSIRLEYKKTASISTRFIVVYSNLLHEKSA